MSAFASRGAARIHWQSDGDGAPLLLAAGLGGGAKTFGTLPRRFGRHGFRCLTYDPVGIAPSSALEGPYEFDEAARDLLAVLDAAEVERCTLAGTSLGGKVALCAAALAPERVSRLVLLASSAVPSARGRRVYRFFAVCAERLAGADFADAIAPFLFGRTFHRERAAVVDDIARATRPDAATLRLMVEQARALGAFDGRARAAAVACPVLCVAGLEDTLTGPDEVAATAAAFPSAELLEVANAGHTLLLESASVFDAVVAFGQRS